MEVRQGLVRRVSDGMAWVEIERQGGCGRCAESGGCGRSCEANAATYCLPVKPDVGPGDRVLVSVPQRAPLVAALMSYGVALAALFCGAVTARLLAGESDAAVAAGAACGLAAAVFWLRHARARASLLLSVTGHVDRVHPSKP
ncbi:MAG: SoxR reducing system RseC family protein [Gammaproteobacteria bacterium]|jgi:sigma-E factor negative regulatory protein RseC|nr:SoxR reducing system RseC family protein [Gammaproteobacteria bacterium]MBU0773106.1 SoxR reducing system RseC family protein [Gammaproteobacteria bacterium]MBU0855744.1 SoxR reducing system RseC family protein [Gammaproteobacteria bacterium]MBU1846987.1 SoxR reducing system RseC family protein [Gammaproteobacteria bacterium]